MRRQILLFAQRRLADALSNFPGPDRRPEQFAALVHRRRRLAERGQGSRERASEGARERGRKRGSEGRRKKVRKRGKERGSEAARQRGSEGVWHRYRDGAGRWVRWIELEREREGAREG
jgi:hypothetical protein